MGVTANSKLSPAKNARTNKSAYHHQGTSLYFCIATQWGSGSDLSRACFSDDITYGPQKKMQCAISPPMESELISPDQALEPVNAGRPISWSAVSFNWKLRPVKTAVWSYIEPLEAKSAVESMGNDFDCEERNTSSQYHRPNKCYAHIPRVRVVDSWDRDVAEKKSDPRIGLLD